MCLVKDKLVCNKLKEYLDDEEKASKEYKELGLTEFSKDEKKHAEYFKEKMKELEC